MDYSTKRNRSTFEAPTSNFDLIPILPNEITLGPLMACMPWYMKPLLMTLNKTWARTLRNPQFATPHYKPCALKNSVILYAYTPTGNGHSLSLHIYEEGILRRLPLPPHIPADSYKFTRFCVTDQCVYSLTPAADQDMYNYCINKLELGGGMINWQTLPEPLPNIGKYIHILSSISKDGNTTHDYIWMRDNAIDVRERRYLSIEERCTMAEANDWSVWELHAGTTQGGRYKSIPPPFPPRPIENFANRPPCFLDIFYKVNLRTRHLYKLYTVSECSWCVNHGNVIESEIKRPCLVIFKDNYDNCVIRKVHLICKQVSCDGSIKVLLYKKELQNSELLQGFKLNDFQNFWGWEWLRQEQITAVKFTADLSPRKKGWKQQFSLASSKGDTSISNEGSTIKMAQQGTIYVYVKISSR